MIKLNKKYIGFFICLSILILSVDLVLMNSLLFIEHEQLLSIAITLDFIVVIPVLLYFLIYRKLNKKLISLAPIALLGYIALLLLLPDTAYAQEMLQLVKYIIIPLEVLFIGYEIYLFTKVVSLYKRNHTTHAHPIESLRASLEATFRNSSVSIISYLVHELSILYYTFCSWRKKPFTLPNAHSFTYHKDSNWLIIILAVSKILILEGALFHILLMQWSHTLSWVLSLGNLYIIFMLIADFRAMCLNPITVDKDKLKIHYGIQLFANMNWEQIDSISVIKYRPLSKEELQHSFTPIAVEPNVHVRLKHEIEIYRLLGKKQRVTDLYLYIDKPAQFQATSQTLINED